MQSTPAVRSFLVLPGHGAKGPWEVTAGGPALGLAGVAVAELFTAFLLAFFFVRGVSLIAQLLR